MPQPKNPHRHTHTYGFRVSTQREARKILEFTVLACNTKKERDAEAAAAVKEGGRFTALVADQWPPRD